MLRSKLESINAGNTNIIPPAIDSPIAANDDTILASKILFLLNNPFKIPVAKIAPGIPAEIVRPTFNPRYVFAAANKAANKTPSIIE